jgi:hypothetical protein
MKTKSAIAVIAASVALVLGLAATSAFGSSAQRSSKHITGSWLVTVDRGPVLGPLSSLQTFTGTGSVIETANTVGIRGPSHGSWEHVSNRLYASTIVFFRFDQGSFVGTQTIRRTLRLSTDGDNFVAVSISELRDAAGNVVAANLRATETAQRMPVERIPDVP